MTYDESLLNELSVFDPGSEVGWRCRDYCSFAFEYEEPFEYMWMIEPDIVAKSPFSHLLDEISTDSAELVSDSLRERDESWSWYSPMARIGYDKVYSVLFPLTHVSSRLIEMIHLWQLRMSDHFLSGKLYIYSKDESPTAAVAISRSCSYTDLKAKNPVLTGENYAEHLRKSISGLNLGNSSFRVLGTSIWRISAANYPAWRQLVVRELARRVDESVFNR